MKKAYGRQLCCPPPPALKLGHFGQVLSGWQMQARAMRPVARVAPSALGQPASRLRPSQHGPWLSLTLALGLRETGRKTCKKRKKKNPDMKEEEVGERKVLPSLYFSFFPTGSAFSLHKSKSLPSATSEGLLPPRVLAGHRQLDAVQGIPQRPPWPVYFFVYRDCKL